MSLIPLQVKLAIAGIGIAVAMAAAVGAYWYGRSDGRELERLAYVEESARNAQEARDDEARLWQANVNDERVLRERAEKGRQNASNDIAKIRVELARTRAAPIPRSFARLLDDNDGAPGSANPATGVRTLGTTGGDPVRGSAGDYISADEFYSAIRENSRRFEENVRKLMSCTAAYNGVRETLLGVQ